MSLFSVKQRWKMVDYIRCRDFEKLWIKLTDKVDLSKGIRCKSQKQRAPWVIRPEGRPQGLLSGQLNQLQQNK